MRDGRIVAEIVPCPPTLAPGTTSPRRVWLPLIEGTSGNVIRPTRADFVQDLGRR